MNIAESIITGKNLGPNTLEIIDLENSSIKHIKFRDDNDNLTVTVPIKCTIKLIETEGDGDTSEMHEVTVPYKVLIDRLVHYTSEIITEAVASSLPNVIEHKGEKIALVFLSDYVDDFFEE